MNKLFKFARKNNITKITLNAIDEHSFNFYLKYDFIYVKMNNDTDYYMYKDISF